MPAVDRCREDGHGPTGLMQFQRIRQVVAGSVVITHGLAEPTAHVLRVATSRGDGTIRDRGIILCNNWFRPSVICQSRGGFFLQPNHRLVPHQSPLLITIITTTHHHHHRHHGHHHHHQHGVGLVISCRPVTCPLCWPRINDDAIQYLAKTQWPNCEDEDLAQQQNAP